MLWWFLLVAAIPILFVVLVLFLVWPGAPRTALRQPFCGRSYAHRGLFGTQQRPPENSLPAFAAAAKGGYGIELDVQFTKDRQLVVFHDDTLDRMTPAQGACPTHRGRWFRHCLWQAAGNMHRFLPMSCAR